MNEVSFNEKIVALQQEWLRDPLNLSRTPDFWHVMDSISDDLVMKWSERASKIRNPVFNTWDSKEWLQLNNILHYQKTYDKMTQMPWTVGQKRFCTFMIMKFWDDLEGIYFCC